MDRTSKLKYFLKQNSVIPNSFIDEFLSMNIPGSTQMSLILDLDVIATWLKIRKGNIVNVLKSSYRLNIDYSIKLKPAKNKNSGSNNYKQVLLTPDCFKRICMRSKSPKSEEVRTYYIQLESMIFKYFEQTIQGMDLDIKRLEKELGPKKPADTRGYIYVLRASEKKDSVYKIGRTKNITQRLASYQTGHLEEIEVVFKYMTSNLNSVETCVKHQLKNNQYRKYKEIYQADIDMIKKLIESCSSMEDIKEIYHLRKPTSFKGGYYIGLVRIQDSL